MSCGAVLGVGVSGGSHASVRIVLEVVWSPWCLEPTSVDVSLAHYGKGVSFRFPHPEVTILSFIIDKFLAADPWGPCKHSVVPQTITVCLGNHH